MLDALGISLPKLIFTIINFAILLFILTKFLYKPFLKMLHNRTETIRTSLTNAEETNREAEEKLARYEQKIARAEEEGQEIIRDASQRARDQANNIVSEAKDQAAQLLENARAEIEREKNNALRDVREQIGSLALMAAERIMEREIQVNGQQEIIDQVLEEAGASKWQS